MLVETARHGVGLTYLQVHGADTKVGEGCESSGREVTTHALPAVCRGNGQVQYFTLVRRLASDDIPGDVRAARRNEKRGAPLERLPEVTQ
ncbi:MAG TPA: hypothetical protein VGA20_02175 [Gemmatimonadales bacterium]